MKKTIAFQGEFGAFSQTAAGILAPGYTPVALPSFREVFSAVADGKCQCAAVPIENTLHGSVHENYDHLLRFNLPILGETFVRIVHNLIAPPGTSLRKLRQVYSHPVALNQCVKFLNANPQFERMPFYDTAGSVKMLMETRPPNAAAIASASAAEIYGATILKRGIEDDRENYTRFFLLRSAARPADSRRRAGVRYKTSVVFTVRNIPGALFRSLSAFALRDLNLTKIESRPLHGRPWDYLFYVDLIGHTDDAAVKNALSHLAELADMWRILGCYPAAS